MAAARVAALGPPMSTRRPGSASRRAGRQRGRGSAVRSKSRPPRPRPRNERLHLFAILAAPPRAHVRGAAGPVVFLPVGTGLIAAVEGAFAGDRIDESALLAHDDVVRRLCEAADAVLPARFTAPLASIGALRATLSPRAAELRGRLRAVRGREQMTLRVIELPEPSSKRGPARRGAPGRRFLEKRRDALVIPALDPVRRAVGAFVEEERVETHTAPLPIAASIHHLVARGVSERYREIVERLVAAGDVPPLAVRGPFPPYAFATGDPR